ncbi:hypothetical protein LCGC14_1057810 [marine sediment metagenome]|uniref:Uncharacterized protein n=1 Tax=marine sediment metagenome TaxID=412755 RepID=A0A0F9QT09_9ZZZZ
MIPASEHGDTIGPEEMDFEGKGPWVIQFARTEVELSTLEAEGYVEVHSKTRVWGTARMMVKSFYP